MLFLSETTTHPSPLSYGTHLPSFIVSCTFQRSICLVMPQALLYLALEWVSQILLCLYMLTINQLSPGSPKPWSNQIASGWTMISFLSLWVLYPWLSWHLQMFISRWQENKGKYCSYTKQSVIQYAYTINFYSIRENNEWCHLHGSRCCNLW